MHVTFSVYSLNNESLVSVELELLQAPLSKPTIVLIVYAVTDNYGIVDKQLIDSNWPFRFIGVKKIPAALNGIGYIIKSNKK